jgi:hypothetical protein
MEEEEKGTEKKERKNVEEKRKEFNNKGQKEGIE